VAEHPILEDPDSFGPSLPSHSISVYDIPEAIGFGNSDRRESRPEEVRESLILAGETEKKYRSGHQTTK